MVIAQADVVIQGQESPVLSCADSQRMALVSFSLGCASHEAFGIALGALQGVGEWTYNLILELNMLLVGLYFLNIKGSFKFV